MASQRPELLFFDVNETLLSLVPIREALGRLDSHPDFTTMWFNSLLHYSLVCSAGGRYFGFGEIGKATLKMLCQRKGLPIDEKFIDEVVGNLLELPAHDDVKAGLTRLKQAGIPMVALTNSTEKGVQQQIQHAGLAEYFQQLLSVEQIKRYKPHHTVYQWAAQTLMRQPQQCMMVAAHGWDVAGAQWAGLRAAFIGRAGQQPFPLAPAPEIDVPDLEVFAEHILAMQPGD